MQLRTRQTPSLVLLICFCWLTPGSSPVCREKPCHYCGNPGQPDNASCFYRSLLGSPGNKSMRSDVRLRDCGQKERSGYLRIISRTGQLLAVHQATWLAPAIFNLFNDKSWIYCSCFSVIHLYYNTGLNFDMNMSMLERIPNTCCINSFSVCLQYLTGWCCACEKYKRAFSKLQCFQCTQIDQLRR